jgi:hypothetical protein
LAALEGSISEFGITDIFQLIYYQRKTGLLSISGKYDRVKILFFEGNIVSATSSRRPEEKKIGNLLIKKGIITEEDLRKVLEEQKRTGKQLGTLLLSHGLVDKETLTEVITQQIIDQVVQIFSWNEGTYVFRPVKVEIETEIVVDTQHVLMEGLRIVDEWSVIEGLITPDTIFRKKTDESDELLSDIEERVFQLIDGESDVSTLLDLSEESELEFLKALVSLMEKGLIEPIEEAVKIQTTKEVESRRVRIIGAMIGVVFAIVFSILVLNAFRGFSEIYKFYRASTTLEHFRMKIESYRLMYDRFPENVDIQLKDPWGYRYIYRVTPTGYELFSVGPDGKEMTEDDVI